MIKRYRAVQYGCGPIGCRVVQYALERSNIELVGAVDIAPDKAGKDLGEIAKVGRKLGITVSGDAGRTLSALKPDIVFHTTGSKFDRVFDQLRGIVEAGCNIVSTCEELSYPYGKHPDLAAQLDKLARANKVTVLATGINPGFLMDTWPIFMTGVCKEVREFRIARIQDASSRRIPFQQKIGAGLNREEFQKKVDSGEFGHVGLPESMSMLAGALGWEIEKVTETIGPVIAEKPVRSDYTAVEVGKVAGISQTAVGYRNGKAVITMEFKAYLGAPESYDSVSITGTPNLEVKIAGGTQGDIGTTSIVVNAVPRVVQAFPGLLTMKDIPIVACAENL